MSTWIQHTSPYYWTGPVGWTICLVITNGKHSFELWKGNGRGDGGGCMARAESLEAAEFAYVELTGDRTNFASTAAEDDFMEEAMEIVNPTLASFMHGKI